ncbi:MAG: hypothetical protein DCC75_02155 [Proteobacteria bacterium]|nr:MAG: hypothetical protein DCC75_02155 [Pseudomonadota bacterium]
MDVLIPTVIIGLDDSIWTCLVRPSGESWTRLLIEPGTTEELSGALLGEGTLNSELLIVGPKMSLAPAGSRAWVGFSPAQGGGHVREHPFKTVHGVPRGKKAPRMYDDGWIWGVRVAGNAAITDGSHTNEIGEAERGTAQFRGKLNGTYVVRRAVPGSEPLRTWGSARVSVET